MDTEVMRYFPKTLTEAETLELVHRINLHFDKHTFGLFAVENKITGRFIGFTGFAVPSFESFFTPCVEIGWRFSKDAWGKGFATEAATACLQYGFNDLGFEKVLSFTSAINLKSEKLMQRIGMRKIAVFNHPKIESSHPLCSHVLYGVDKSSYFIALRDKDDIF